MNVHLSTRSLVLAAVVSTTMLCSIALADSLTDEGKVVTVTLYRNQALVQRELTVTAGLGEHELVVTGLPEATNSQSLFAMGSDSVLIRGVRFRARAVKDEPRPEIRKIDEALKAAARERAEISLHQQLNKKRLSTLDRMDHFVATTAKAEFAKGVLNAETLKTITLFSNAQRTEAMKAILKANQEAHDLDEREQHLHRQRAELTGASSRTVREAVLFLEKTAATPATVKLSYIVAGAGWAPVYNVHAKSGEANVALEYNALIHQQSGEAWNNVTLTLSTASPWISAESPGLAPFRVALSGGQNKKQDLRKAVALLRTNRREAQVQQQSAQGWNESLEGNWQMNRAAMNLQEIELQNALDAVRDAVAIQKDATNGVSVSYTLASTVSLASRADQQLVRITRTKLPATLYHVAVPVLTPYVYREAELQNTYARALLGGPATVYLDGQFVGRAQVPSVASGERFAIGLGADAQLRARRQLVNRTENVQGGNREVTFAYRLTIDNLNATSANVRLFDRMPVADQEASIRVQLTGNDAELSKDADYNQLERPKGILRWDLTAAANTTGTKATAVNFTYTIDFDKNYQLSTGQKQQANQEEFKELMRGRYRK